MIAFQPKAAAEPLQTSAGAAQAFRSVGAQREVADLAAVGIGAAPDAAVLPNAAADAGGKRHVEERRAALPRAEFGLSDGAHVGIVIHDGGRARDFPHEAAQIEIAPAAHVSRKHDALRREIHRPAEADAAALQLETPAATRRRSSRSAPPSMAAAAGIGGARFPAHHAVAVEDRHAEFRAANVNRQNH